MPHPVEATLRASIAAIQNMTGETNKAIGQVVGLSVPLVGRRQRGITPWTVAELGGLADHWQIPVCSLLAGPSDALAELPSARVVELRTARGLPIYSSALQQVA